MILAHPLAGFSVTSICKSFWKNLTPKQEKIVWLTGVTASILPDFDLLYAFITKSSSHHQYITHTPIFYLTLSLIATVVLFVIEKYHVKIKQKALLEVGETISQNSKLLTLNSFTRKFLDFARSINIKQIEFIERLIIVFLTNTVVHVLMDIPVGSIRPFWPVYTEVINVFHISPANWMQNYFSSPAIFVEIFWVILGIIFTARNWGKKDLKFGIGITVFWFLVAVISTLLLIN